MGTRSYIAYFDSANDEYYAIYCHFDGYPEGVGRTLVDHYDTRDRVVDLIAQGSISSLGAKLEPDPGLPHTFEDRQRDVTLAYHRDRGEDWELAKPRHFGSLYALTEGAKQAGAEYVYVFNNGSWEALTLIPHFVPVIQLLGTAAA